MKLKSLTQYVNGYFACKNFTAPPVIIGGCERSGTSLLQSIVSAHPQIFAINEETWSFCYGPVAGFNSNKPIRIERLYKALGDKEIPGSCTRWSEKSPANVFYFDSILNYFSNNVRLIQIIRDGRDVVTSMHPGNASKPWVSIDRWVQAMEAGYQYENCAQVLTIKYEDLILDFNETVKRICQHVEVNVDEQILHWHKHATIKRNKNLIGTSVKQLSDKSINKFKAEDFKYQNIVDDLMENDRAVRLLQRYKYL